MQGNIGSSYLLPHFKMSPHAPGSTEPNQIISSLVFHVPQIRIAIHAPLYLERVACVPLKNSLKSTKRRNIRCQTARVDSEMGKPRILPIIEALSVQQVRSARAQDSRGNADTSFVNVPLSLPGIRAVSSVAFQRRPSAGQPLLLTRLSRYCCRIYVISSYTLFHYLP